MFDKYLIGENSLRNLEAGGEVTGFAFDARLGYYRGLGLSMVEDLAVTVDGEAVPREAVRFHHDGRALSLQELETEYDGRWEFGEFATISVEKPGGLAAGEHAIGLREALRVSYLPFLLTAADTKTLPLAG